MFKLSKPKIHNEGIWGTHDMPCAVCHKRHAVMDCQTEVFYPCRECEEKGWVLKKKKKLFNWLKTREHRE